MLTIEDIVAVGPHEIAAECAGEYDQDEQGEQQRVVTSCPGDLLWSLPGRLSAMRRPRTRHRLYRFHHCQQDNGDQQHHRQFIEPAVPHMAVRVPVVLEIQQQFPAVEVVADQHCEQ